VDRENVIIVMSCALSSVCADSVSVVSCAKKVCGGRKL